MTNPPQKAVVRLPRALLALTEHLVACLVACRIHEPSHPRVVAALSQVRDALHELRAETGEQAFTLAVQGETLIFQGRLPIPQNISAARLVEALRRWRANGLQVHAEVPDAELATLFRILLRTPDHVVADASAVNRAMAELGVLAVRLVPGSQAEPAPTAPRSSLAQHVTRSPAGAVIDGAETLFTGIAAGQPLDMVRARRCVESLLATLDAAATGAETIDLGTQPEEDHLLVLHSLRVAGLAMLAARGLTRDNELVLRLGTAALVHDIGKLRMPLHLVTLEGDDHESTDATLREHPRVGAELVLQQQNVDPLQLEVVFGHHRSINGQGFPDTPHDHRPSRFVQIVQILDRFESMTARRADRAPMTPTLAWRSLARHSDTVDPGLLRRVIEAIGIWPLGAEVTLSNGDVGRVVKATRDPAAPIVRITSAGPSSTAAGLVDLSRMRGSPVRVAGVGPAAPTH